MPKLYFIAGEESGDIHGANVLRALEAQCPGVECAGLGGQHMAGAGMRLDYDLANEAIMGFVEVVKHYPSIRRLFFDTLDWIEAFAPDGVVLIDYPGFNIRIAKELKKRGIPVIYYISPQVWAWKKGRLKTLAGCVDHMMVIFPFEVELYAKAGVPCTYVGHPLLDHVQKAERGDDLGGEPLVGLLPGSREQEIARLLEPMIEMARGVRETMPGARFVIPCVNEARAAQVRGLLDGFDAEVLVGGMDRVLDQAQACLVASGTATLQTALFGVPMCILYKTSGLTYLLARAVVDIEHIGIVNILAGRGIVPEFIQHEARAESILPQFLPLLQESPARAQMLSDLEQVRSDLGGGGASDNAARVILDVLEGGSHGG